MSIDGHKSAESNRSDAPLDDEEEGGLDLAAIRDYLSFVPHAAARHKLLVFCVFVLVVTLTKFVAWVLPRHYYVESKLLAQRNQVIGALAVQSRVMPDAADAPTRLAAETVLRRDNLLALVKRCDLVKDWREHRHPVRRFKDDMMAKLGFVPSDADLVEAMVATLESSLSVQAPSGWTTEGTVVIGVDWSNAQMAYKLGTVALQNFLEARHISEIDSISEAIAILTGRADAMRQEIDSAALLIEAASRGAPPPETAEDTTRPRADGGRRPRPSLAQAAIAAVAPEGPPPTSQEVIQLRASWEAKRAAIRDLEDIRRRKVAELQTRLTELKMTYADSYPMILDTKRSIEMLSEESPQVAQLRREEADLREQYRERTGDEPDAPPRASGPTAGLAQLLQREPGGRSGNTHVQSSVVAASAPAATDDRAMEFLKAQLRLKMETYDRLLERIDNAKMEMETAEVAFKYRYTVIRPAQLPTAPTKPNVTAILAGGVAAGIGLALLLAVLLDLLSGRVVERWQVERMLELPVIAELHMK